jgi:hypothetical protein
MRYAIRRKSADGDGSRLTEPFHRGQLPQSILLLRSALKVSKSNDVSGTGGLGLGKNAGLDQGEGERDRLGRRNRKRIVPAPTAAPIQNWAMK